MSANVNFVVAIPLVSFFFFFFFKRHITFSYNGIY